MVTLFNFDDVRLLKGYDEYKRGVFQGFSLLLCANRMTVDRNCWLIYYNVNPLVISRKTTLTAFTEHIFGLTELFTLMPFAC